MSPIHPLAWALWGTAAIVSIQIAPNPVYVAAVLIACSAVVAVHGHGGPLTRAFPALLTIGVVFALVRIVLAGLTTRGGGPVLLTLPSAEVPAALGGFTVGGPLDAGVLVRAAAEGFVIVGIMAVCGAFNAVVDHHQLLRLIPRAFAEMGVAVAVAVAFVPTFLDAAKAAGEADRARTGGVAVRRGRWRRLTGPVIERALEQAVALAESMDSRGFGRAGPTPGDRRAVALSTLGMVVMAAGLGVLATGSGGMAITIVLAGAAMVVGAVIVASRASTRTRHRVLRVERRDLLIGASALAVPAVLAILATTDATVRWVGDDVAWPPSTLAPLLAIALLTAPALRARRLRRP